MIIRKKINSIGSIDTKLYTRYISHYRESHQFIVTKTIKKTQSWNNKSHLNIFNEIEKNIQLARFLINKVK